MKEGYTEQDLFLNSLLTLQPKTQRIQQKVKILKAYCYSVQINVPKNLHTNNIHGFHT